VLDRDEDDEDDGDAPATATSGAGGVSTGPSAVSRSSELDSPLSMLSRMPGVTPSNLALITTRFVTLCELAEATEEEIQDAIGKANGTMLYKFLHASTASY
jgi:ERCC4-type nuclease